MPAMPDGLIWEVIGGKEKGGIVVRLGPDATSPQASSRLSNGALVRQVELQGKRLHYEKLKGEGPGAGWVCVRLADGRSLLAAKASARGGPAAAGGRGEEAPGGEAPGRKEEAASGEAGGEKGSESTCSSLEAGGGKASNSTRLSLEEAASGEAGGEKTGNGTRLSPEEEWEASPEVDLPQVSAYQVCSQTGVSVFAENSTSSGPPTQKLGDLRSGSIVAVVACRGSWRRLAKWELVTGWVSPVSVRGGPSLQAAPTHLEGLLRTRATVLREEQHMVMALKASRPWSPLPRSAVVATQSYLVHNPVWGIAASCYAGLTALGPPGREWRVFSARSFAAGEQVEQCEGLGVDCSLAAQSGCTLALRGRVFVVPGRKCAMILLGFGALYRRVTSRAAATVEMVPAYTTGRSEAVSVVLRALRDVQPSEELTVCLPADRFGAPVLDAGQEVGRRAWPTAALYQLPSGWRATGGMVYVGQSQIHGLGVFAACSFQPGDVVELCPALVLDIESISTNPLPDYRMSFEAGLPGLPDELSRAGAARHAGAIDPAALWWPPVGDRRPPRVAVIALGVGPIYNHAALPEDKNISWSLHPGMGVVVMRAETYIRKDAELFIDYGRNYWRGRNLQPVGTR